MLKLTKYETLIKFCALFFIFSEFNGFHFVLFLQGFFDMYFDLISSSQPFSVDDYRKIVFGRNSLTTSPKLYCSLDRTLCHLNFNTFFYLFIQKTGLIHSPL